MCWPTYSTGFCILEKMARYEKEGRYDDAISSGLAWTEKHPEGIDSEWIYREISLLYLKKASLDQKHKEDYLQQALSYRDKLLPSASNSPYTLEPLETISEYVGDLSTTQRCVQYRNSIKLLDSMNTLLSEDKARLARQFKGDPDESEKVQRLSSWIDIAKHRVESKQLSAGCH